MLALITAAAAFSAGCASDSLPSASEQRVTDREHSAPMGRTSPKPHRPSPMGCLRKQGTMDPEQRMSTMWRGMNPINGTAIIVQRERSEADAIEAISWVSAIEAYVAGKYSVTGPLKGKDPLHYTKSVAMCLDRK
jgi:hypothetical protein